MTKPIIVVKIPCKLLYQKTKLSVTSVDSHIPIYNATHNQYCKFNNFEAILINSALQFFCNFHYRVIHQYRVCI